MEPAPKVLAPGPEKSGENAAPAGAAANPQAGADEAAADSRASFKVQAKTAKVKESRELLDMHISARGILD